MVWSDPYIDRCAIIYLEGQDEKTSVRTDSSASRASAREKQARARLLFPKTSTIATGDRVELQNLKLRVIGVFPRHNLQGELDHYQVDLERWA